MVRRVKKEGKCKISQLKPHSEITRKKKKSKKIGHILKAKKFVCNFSCIPLKNSEILLLNKGLKFAYTPKRPTLGPLINAWSKLAKSMRLQYFHIDKKRTGKKHPFRNKSNGTPPLYSDSIGIDNYLYNTRLELEKLSEKIKQSDNVKSNLTRHQLGALRSLSKRSDIVINKADKGSMTVIRSRDEYVKEGERQLLNCGYYEPIPNDMCSEMCGKIHSVLQRMHSNDEIDLNTFQYLDPLGQNTHTAEMYHLGKVHKPLTDEGTLNSRAIISGCGTPTERISEYLEFFLTLIALQQSTHVKDTTDLLCKLEALKLPPDVFLIVGDIASMYSNIPHDDAQTIIGQSLKDNEGLNYGITRPSTESLMELAKIIFEGNYFKFDGKHYRQTCGLAMGSRASVSGSDIVVHHFERQLLEKYNKQLLIFLRFRDDVFGIFDGSLTECEQFMSDANSLHPKLKFNFEISQDKVSFLDVDIFKGQRFENQGILDFSTHFKPTNKFQYIHRDSCHPPGVFNGLIKGELLRYARNTNNTEMYNTQADNFKTRLINRGYSSHEINAQSDMVAHENRQEFLKNKKKKGSGTPLTFVTGYSPYYRGDLNAVLKKHWHYVSSVPKLANLFHRPPVLAYKRNKNISDSLVRAKLRPLRHKVLGKMSR